jgi:hypothetical protein
MDTAFDHAGNERFFGLRKFGVAEGNDDALTRQSVAIAIGVNELDEPRALYEFYPKIHERKE